MMFGYFLYNMIIILNDLLYFLVLKAHYIKMI